MKKTTLLILVLLGATVAAVAQDVEDEPVFPEQDPLPEVGDYSIGFDAVPIMEYFGNIFNGTQNNSVGAEFVNQQVFGKYFLSDEMAVRTRLRVNQDITENRFRVMQDNQEIPDSDVQVTDERTDYNTLVRIGGGVEFRRGEGRLVGVYGAEASFLYGNSSSSYDYGNPMTAGNPEPTSAWGTGTQRPVEERHDQRLGFGLNGFAGVEYFIAPKISLGAEFTLGADFLKEYRGNAVNQYWDNTSESIETRETVTEGGNEFSFDTGNYGGSINLMFYF